jgi:GT2 family glycosyltransferase
MPLNPDLVLLPDYVTEMVKAIQQHERIGSVSGKLMFMMEDGRETDLIYSTGHLLTRSRSPTNRGYKKRDVGQYEQVEPIFAANGAAPLYRRAMLEDVALGDEYFCEDFFVYGEDHDLGWRSQLRGWQCFYTPHAVGYHCGFGSGGIHTSFVQVQFTRNRYLTLVRNDCLTHFLGDLPYVLMYELIWQLSRLVRSPRRLLAHWRGLVEAAKAIPRARQARDEIQQRRRVSPGYIRAFYTSQLW